MEKQNAPEADQDDPIQVAWDSLEGSWSKDDAHRKFLALCESLNRLDEAGRRYRSVAEAGGDRASEAKTRIDQLMVRAMARMTVARTEPNTRPRSLILLVGFLLAAGLLAFAASFFLQ